MNSFRFACAMRCGFAAAFTVAVVSLGGCAFSNEGAIDYRKAEPATAARLKEFRNQVGVAGTGPLLLSPLLRKDVELPGDGAGNSEAQIVKLDKVSIRLREGFLHDCNEFWPSPLRKLKKNCEIAILFRAFELGEGKGQDFDFKPGAERDARLVYFSHDVQPGQFFNLHNMPVYGPAEFGGKPLGLDIFILEIDAEHKQAYALLRSLATAGGQPIASANPVLGVLDGLGKSLLSGGTDDVEFRYSFVLDPASAYKGTAFATMEAGDYVLMRSEERDQNIDWSRLYLDHNTGRVWIDRDGKQELYRDHTYLTVQVLRNAGTEKISLAQNTYGAFRAALEEDATEKAEKVEAVAKAVLQPLLLKRVQVKAFHKAQQLLEDIVAKCGPDGAGARHLWSPSAYDLHGLLKKSVVQQPVCKTGDEAKASKATDDGKDANNKKEPDNDLDAEQIDHLLQKLRSRAAVHKEKDLKAYTNSCAGFVTLTFEAFAAQVCKVTAKGQK